MTYRVEYGDAAREDIYRLYRYILERDPHEWTLAEEALDAIKMGSKLLELTPFSFRMASPPNPHLRELVVPFGNTGYVLLYRILEPGLVVVLAVRHQREDGY